MALDVAVDRLTAAVRALAGSPEQLGDRLQRAWSSELAHLWTSVYLPDELNERFKRLWHNYTDTDDEDPHTTRLRALTTEQQSAAAEEIVALTLATIAAAAQGAMPAEPPNAE